MLTPWKENYDQPRQHIKKHRDYFAERDQSWVFIVRESFPRHVDKKSRGHQGERGLEFSRRKKGKTFFFPTIFIRIMYPARGQSLD